MAKDWEPGPAATQPTPAIPPASLMNSPIGGKDSARKRHSARLFVPTKQRPSQNGGRLWPQRSLFQGTFPLLELKLKLDLQTFGEQLGDQEIAFRWWMAINRTHLLDDAGQHELAKMFAVDVLEAKRKLTKQGFLRHYMESIKHLRGR